MWPRSYVHYGAKRNHSLCNCMWTFNHDHQTPDPQVMEADKLTVIVPYYHGSHSRCHGHPFTYNPYTSRVQDKGDIQFFYTLRNCILKNCHIEDLWALCIVKLKGQVRYLLIVLNPRDRITPGSCSWSWSWTWKSLKYGKWLRKLTSITCTCWAIHSVCK